MNQGQAMVGETKGDYEVGGLTRYIFLLSPISGKENMKKKQRIGWVYLHTAYSNCILKAWERNNFVFVLAIQFQ